MFDMFEIPYPITLDGFLFFLLCNLLLYPAMSMSVFLINRRIPSHGAEEWKDKVAAKVTKYLTCLTGVVTAIMFEHYEWW